MKTVFFDITRLLNRCDAHTPTGIDRVDINYANYFLENLKYNAVFIFQKKSAFYLFEEGNLLISELYSKWIRSEKVDVNSVSFQKKYNNPEKTKSDKLESLISQSDELLNLPDYIDGRLCDALMAAREGRAIYVNVSHHGVGGPGVLRAYHAFKVLGGVSIIFYLHDIIPIDFPEYVREGDEKTHHNRVKSMVECGDLVLVNSLHTKERLIYFCKKNNLTVPDVEILIIGVETIFVDKAKSTSAIDFLGGSAKYFVYISTIEPRKNHLLLLHLWRQMFMDGRIDPPKLVLIGKRGWNNQNLIDILDRSLFAKTMIVELSGLSDEQMIAVLKGSQALLYPSFEEGWGMPLVEAIVANVPVVCSDIPAHRESGQMLPIYLSPTDGSGWQGVIDQLAKSDEFRCDMLNRYKNFKVPNWQEHFASFENAVSNFKKEILTPVAVLSTREIAHRYLRFEKKQRINEETLRSYGFWYRVLFRIIFGDIGSERAYRLVRKFRNDPIRYMLDSKNLALKKFGELLQQFSSL